MFVILFVSECLRDDGLGYNVIQICTCTLSESMGVATNSIAHIYRHFDAHRSVLFLLTNLILYFSIKYSTFRRAFHCNILIY